MNSDIPKRILLLLTARTYRAKDFRDAAEKLGVEICAAVDMKQELAEYWNYPLGVDFSNPEQTVQAIKEFAQNKPIGAILTVDDSGSSIAAEASQELGLGHNSPEAALAARDKYLMRSKLQEAGIKVPAFSLHYFAAGSTLDQSSHNEIARRIEYPVVVKPLNLNGSRGVIRADTPEGFTKAAARLSQIMQTMSPPSEEIPYLVESYVDGLEVAVEGLLDNCRLHILAIFDKPDPLIGPYFEETIYITPSELPPDVQEQIASSCSAAAAAIGLREGPVHAEIRINNQGVWLIEIAGRSIGGLCSRTLQFGIESSLEELIIRQSLGMDFEALKRQDFASGVMMIPIPERGMLRGISGIQDAERVDLVEKVEITARLNYSLIPLPEGDSYLGFIFARGHSTKSVESALRRAHKKLDFDILPELMITPDNRFFNYQT